MSTTRGNWIAVVGSRAEGRIAVVERLAGALRAADVSIGGFVEKSLFEGDVVEGYDLVHIVSEERYPLARTTKVDPELCQWAFSADGFEKARAWALEGEHTVAFVEAGRLEAAERGHWETLRTSLRERPFTVVGIRRSVLASIALRFPDPVDAIELPTDTHEVTDFVERVKGRLVRTLEEC